MAASASALVLAGCLAGNDTSRDGTPATAGQVSSVGTVEQDVEAPEIFRRVDRGLWDGRPSLGGVWVAHPDVNDPERVIIRNPSTGREVVGALFRRERENPGPPFQVSSDAATALGMLAGNPAEIRVTALRTQLVRPAPAAAAADTPGADTPATAAEDSADAAETAERAPDTAPPTQRSEPVSPPEQTRAEPRRSLWPFGRRDARAEAAPDAGTISATPLDDMPETAALPPDPVASADAGITTPEASAPRPPALERGFVQLGIFSVEANAERAARMAREAGLQAHIRIGQNQENRFWRVTVGPAATVDERARLLARVRELGFTDAYAVAR